MILEEWASQSLFPRQFMESNEYDLIVIGSGPAGQKGAICAAKMRKKVAIIDRKLAIGGVCVHTGTIPSKTLRKQSCT